jgi:hypothetical protein
LSKSKMVAKTARHYSDYFHKEYMESYNQDLRTGHYRDLLSEVIDIMDTLEARMTDNWYRKLIRKVKK